MTEPADPHLDMDLPAIPVVPPRARTLGELLRTAREAKGLALADIAARTRVPERTLVAIEADAYEQLPHPTFASGFIRSLAREVGVSDEEAMTRYRAENTRLAPTPITPPMRAIEPERIPSRALAWVSAGVAALAIVGAIWWFGHARDASPLAATTVAASPVAGGQPATDLTAPAPAPGAAPTTVPAAADAAALSPAVPPPMLGTPGGPVTLTATQDVWLQVRDKATGQRVISSVLAQGQTYAVPPGGMELWTGRAGALQVRVNGRLLPPLGGPAETVRNVDLSPEALAARSAGTPPDAGTTLPAH